MTKQNWRNISTAFLLMLGSVGTINATHHSAHASQTTPTKISSQANQNTMPQTKNYFAGINKQYSAGYDSSTVKVTHSLDSKPSTNSDTDNGVNQKYIHTDNKAYSTTTSSSTSSSATTTNSLFNSSQFTPNYAVSQSSNSGISQINNTTISSAITDQNFMNSWNANISNNVQSISSSNFNYVTNYSQSTNHSQSAKPFGNPQDIEEATMNRKMNNLIAQNDNPNAKPIEVPNPNVLNNTDYNYKRSIHTDSQNKRLRAKHFKSIEGNTPTTFGNPVWLHYSKDTNYQFGLKHGDPQSMTISPDGTLYVLYNAGHGNSSLNRIGKYTLNGQMLQMSNIFMGGHGQGLNYINNQLVMDDDLYNHHGILPDNLHLDKINMKTLTPDGIYVINNGDNKDTNLGENFAYDKDNNNYYNVARDYSKKTNLPKGSLNIYEGTNQLQLVRTLAHSPAAVIQNIKYNPDNQRLYIVGNGIIVSMPANNLQNITDNDIKVTKFRHYEFEDVAFYNHKIYLLTNKPTRVYMSNEF